MKKTEAVPMGSGELAVMVSDALSRRESIIETFKSDKTDAYRLFHGTVEGWAGLNVERFGEAVLVTTFREPLNRSALDEIAEALGQGVVYRHRGSREDSVCEGQVTHDQQFVVTERGVKMFADLTGDNLDPGLFLDFRGARRFVASRAEGKSLLNLFSYTCTMGLVATMAGATKVVNSDHSAGHLLYGERNYRENGCSEEFESVRGDFTPVCRQFAGLPVRGRAAKKHSYPKLAQESFDVVVLDPPTRTKSPFGGVDINRDYPSLLKPALMATAEGGCLVATHHHHFKSREEWGAELRKTIERCSREVRSFRFLENEPDFPSHDGEPPLKIAVIEV
jgi:23S rRNA (cytosine1962-C5)-methyltransferase